MLSDEHLSAEVRSAFDADTRAQGRASFGGDPAWAVEFFIRFYHRPLSRHLDLSQATAIECACGLGQNALAFVLAGGKSIVGYDLSAERVDAANALAHRLGLSDRARFEVGDIHALPRTKPSVVFSLQTLEHVPRPIAALRGLADRASRALVISTPNLLFPRDGHDTGLMFAHWLPEAWRRRYATLRGARTAELCRFLSAAEIQATIPDFRRSTPVYNFSSLEEWLEQFPCFFPYGAGGGRFLGARAHRPRWRAATLAAAVAPELAAKVAPMVEGIWLRTDPLAR